MRRVLLFMPGCEPERVAATVFEELYGRSRGKFRVAAIQNGSGRVPRRAAATVFEEPYGRSRGKLRVVAVQNEKHE